MNPKLARARERSRAKTISALETLAQDATAPAAMRRAATLRLGRLRAAVATPAASMAATPAKKPTIESLVRGVKIARETFMALHAHRAALIRKTNRTAADTKILMTLLDKMPAVLPAINATDSDLCVFVGHISNTLAALKALPKNL